jgi:hypothetical protein
MLHPQKQVEQVIDNSRDSNGKWLKGVSGNKNGRAGKGETFAEIIREALEGVDGDGITKKQAIVDTMISKAIAGEIRATEWLSNRSDGLPIATQKLQVDETRMRHFEELLGVTQE